MNIAPVAYPTTRDVTPVATDAPTEPDVVPTPGVPSDPARIIPMLLAVSPPRIAVMLGRCHCVSLIFCTVVRSPMARSDPAIAAIANGSIRFTAITGQPMTGAGAWTNCEGAMRISENGT